MGRKIQPSGCGRVVYEFGPSGFGWRLAHRTAVAAGLLTGLLSLGYGAMLIVYSALHQYAGGSFGYSGIGGPSGLDFTGIQAPSCLLAAAEEPARPVHLTASVLWPRLVGDFI
jgi:hypothetical protein